MTMFTNTMTRMMPTTAPMVDLDTESEKEKEIDIDVIVIYLLGPVIHEDLSIQK